MKLKKTILTDADGVLLNWEFAFNIWMQEHGFTTVKGYQFMYDMAERYGIPKDQVKKLVRQFNESATIGYLPALRDAVQYVTKLADEGWEFHCITSLSKNKYAQRLRRKNLDKIFGKGVFTKLICLDTGDAKDDVLAKYKDSKLYWIEDKPENAEAGLKQGLKPILVEHGHNMKGDYPYPKAKDWEHIYNIVTA
tara:strand:+ start:1266 stop:1847 length:582 start_codon:yes stop_codon:yes gene_type:complete